MTRRTDRDGTTYTCNHAGCNATYRTAYKADLAWSRARAHGWKIKFVGVAVLHFCGWIHARERAEETTT